MARMQTLFSTLFSHGFRPLFLLMALYALVGPLLWLLAWTGALPATTTAINPWWHGHDMLMGLAGAAIGGFLLTAVPNWTSTPPVHGQPLIMLCLLWISGRILPSHEWPSLVADAGYWILLCGLVAGPILRKDNRRNHKVLALIAVLALTDTATHLAVVYDSGWLQQAVWLQLWLIVLLINLIGGRIIPAFTGNWLRQHSAEPPAPAELPAGFAHTDLAGGIATALFALGVVTGQPALLTVPAGAAATLLQLIRLYRWKPWKTLADPLVGMLHLSWAWLATGLLLWTLAEAQLVPVSAAVHALGIGAMGSMIISVASRAAMGHTGRPLRSHPLLNTAILLLSLAALTRIIAASAVAPWWLWLSGGCWSLAFLIWLVRFAPILTGPSEAPQGQK